MSNKEILAIYKTAEKHWSRPAWLCWIFGWNYTYYGLCYYFQVQHTKYYCSPYFKELWYPCRTIQFNAYHFNTRKERLQAIRKVIKALENEQFSKRFGILLEQFNLMHIILKQHLNITKKHMGGKENEQWKDHSS